MSPLSWTPSPLPLVWTAMASNKDYHYHWILFSNSWKYNIKHISKCASFFHLAFQWVTHIGIQKLKSEKLNNTFLFIKDYEIR